MQSKSDNVGIFVTAFYLLFELYTVSINALSCRPTCTFSESHLLCPLHTIYRIHSEYILNTFITFTTFLHTPSITCTLRLDTITQLQSVFHYMPFSIIVLSAFPDDPPQC